MRIYLGFDITKLVVNLLWIIPIVVGVFYIYLNRKK